jgi:hypothetical protein
MTIVILPASTGSPNRKSQTGAIAGGVAGGVAVLVAALIIFILLWRRNRRREEFVGTFDPGRVVRPAGNMDIPGAQVTPYSYDPTSSSFSGPTSANGSMQYRDSQGLLPTSPTFSANGSMQYRDSQALLGNTYGGAGGGATATTGSQYAPTSSDGASVPPGSSSHGRSNSYGSAGIAPGFPVAQPYRPLSSKELEALHRRGAGGLGLASAPEEGEGNVIQHSDGGGIAEPVPPGGPPQEIPPSYYSISGHPY